MKGNCAICGTEIDVRICCNAFDCGCQGLPIDPPVCSEKCYYEFMDNPIKPTPLKTERDGN